MLKVRFYIVFLFLVQVGYSQETTLSVLSVNENKGLSDLTNSFIFRDSKGLVWISSLAGLNLFDGEKVKSFYAEPNDPYAIKNDLITSTFFEDQEGNIWFSTNESIEQYNRIEGRFYTHTIDSTQDTLSRTDYYAFHLEDNILWLRQGYGPEGKLYHLNINTGEFSFKGAIDGNRQAIVRDAEGKITRVLASMLSSGRGFNVYYLQDTIVRQQNYSNQESESLSWLNFYTTNILVNSEEEIWMGAKNGLLHINLIANEVNLIDELQGQALGLVWGLITLNEGEIAFSAKKTKGLLAINRKSRQKSREIKLIDREGDFNPLDNPTEVYLDSQNILWTSYWKEGIKYTFFKEDYFENYFNKNQAKLPKDRIVQVLELNNQSILVTTSSSGVFEYQEEESDFRLVIPPFSDSATGDQKITLFEDRSGQLWGSIQQNLYKIDLSNVDNIQSSALASKVDQIFQLNDGRLILYTFQGEFFQINNSDQGGFELNTLNLIDPLPGDIDKVYIDRDGLVYVFHDVNNLSVYEPREKGKACQLLKKITSIGLVSSFFEPESGDTLWLTSNKGLFSLDKSFLYSAEENKKPEYINFRSLKSLAGKAGKGLWMSTQEGIVNYFPQAKSNRLFTKFDGLLNIEPAANAFLIDKKNRLWVGGDNGLSLMNLDQIDTIGVIPNIHIQSILINNQNLPESPNVAEIEALKLSYRQNSLGFEFASTEFSSPNKNQFRYRLRENDKWIELGNRSELYFDQLPYDNYKLQIQASNADGIWMESPKTIRVRISPPFWQEWWFYLLLLLLAIGVGYWFFDNWARKREMRLESQRLKELDELKTRLYTNITHEFRTPLTVISGMSGQIKGNLVEKKMIFRNSRRLLNLVNQMLDLAKIDQGSMQLNLGQSDVVAFLKYVVETYQPFAATKQIYLSIQSAMPFRIMDFDQDKLDQILSNLLSNAIKFTPEKGMVNVHIDEQMVGEEVMLYLSVKDNGKGIPKDKLTHIFDRFYQVDDGDNRVSEGTGIGLSLCKELVELMEGNIQVESDPDSGTLFTILLPIRQEAEWRPFADPEESLLADDDIATTPQPDQDAAPEVAPKLLIVEDNPDVATYLSSLLQKTYQVSYASNGKIGLKAAQEEVPDIIISDVMMPEMDGFELCEHLKTEMATSHIPIILLTAKSHMEDKLEGLSKGADAYLTKPFNKEELQIRLEQLIKVRKNLQNKYGRDLINIKLKKEDDQDDEFINALRTTVIERISDPELSPVDLEKAVFLSGSQVNRKLKALTRMTPTEFIRSIRLEKALILLKTTDLAITQVAFEVGFNQPGYFTRRFQEKYDCTPSSIRG